MALFGKKNKTVTCAICGKEEKTGLFRSLFQQEIEGKYVCGSCYGVVDLPRGKIHQMRLEDFRRYMTFREENRKLRTVFQITDAIDLRVMDTKFVFDRNHQLLCMSKDLHTTIFEAKHIRSFVIREDECTILSGSPEGLISRESNVYDQIIGMIPQIRRHQMAMIRYQDRLENAPEEKKEEVRQSKPKCELAKPFHAFQIEIHFDHPYWDVFTATLPAPDFDGTYPDANDYLNIYNHRFAAMEKLAELLMALAFPNAKDLRPKSAQAAVPVDAVAELKRYKELLDLGIITETDFNAKKAQLLGLS